MTEVWGSAEGLPGLEGGLGSQRSWGPRWVHCLVSAGPFLRWPRGSSHPLCLFIFNYEDHIYFYTLILDFKIKIQKHFSFRFHKYLTYWSVIFNWTLSKTLHL